MKTKSNIKLPKVNHKHIETGGGILIAAGTIIKAGYNLVKEIKKMRGK